MTTSYLGGPIDGITAYRVVVDGRLWGAATGIRTFTWSAAKLLAEHVMEQHPSADVEIVGIVPRVRKP